MIAKIILIQKRRVFTRMIIGHLKSERGTNAVPSKKIPGVVEVKLRQGKRVLAIKPNTGLIKKGLNEDIKRTKKENTREGEEVTHQTEEKVGHQEKGQKSVKKI